MARVAGGVGFNVVAGRVSVSGFALDKMVANPDGPVGTVMLRYANVVLALAEIRCPVETAESAARHRRQAGRLKASLHVTRDVATNGIAMLVGSDLIYARRIEFNPKVGGFLRGALHDAGVLAGLNSSQYAYGVPSGTIRPGGVVRPGQPIVEPDFG